MCISKDCFLIKTSNNYSISDIISMKAMKNRTDFHKTVIGRAEELSFIVPEIPNVPSKVDTGAYRSAVHAANIKLSKDGKILSFVLLGNHPVCGAMSQKVETNSFKQVQIANSFGHTEMRYEVRLRVKMGPKVFLAAFTLANRTQKIYPVLLGRKMLNGRFFIDTAETSIDRVELKKKYGIVLPVDEEQGREVELWK